MNKEHLKKDYLIDRNCSFYQDRKDFCCNTDTVLLAQFIQCRKGDSVLEIGTNNGALLVYLDRFEPSLLTGVEIRPQAASLAALNCTEFVKHDWKVFNEDIRTFQAPYVDLVVCNPPFFTLEESKGIENPTQRQLGRVEYNLNLEQLIQSASRLLKSGGRFCFVHRPDRMAQAMALLEANHLALRRFAVAFDARDSQPKALLYEAVKDGTCRVSVQPPVWIGKDS